MSHVNVLSMEWRSGPRRPHLVAAEFIVDGRSLLEHCERATAQTFDVVSPFGWTPPNHQQAVAERLLLRRPPLLPSGRQELLVCPECADLGCGCISAAVRYQDGQFVWNDLGYENDYDSGSLSLFPMGNLVFTEDDVRHLLARHVCGLGRS